MQDVDRSQRAETWAAVRAVQGGDTAEFGRLYERYSRMILGYFLARGFDRSTAEDLTSETFARALRAIGSVVDQGKDVRAWLVTIARNLSKDHARAGRNRFEFVVAELPDHGPTVAGPENRVLARIELVEVGRMLRELSDEQRQCLLHRRVLGRSVKDTAARMNRSGEAVRALLHRAVLSLDAAMAG